MTEKILVKSVRKRNKTYLLDVIYENINTIYSLKDYNMSIRLRVHLNELLNGESYIDSLHMYLNVEFIKKSDGTRDIFYADLSNIPVENNIEVNAKIEQENTKSTTIKDMGADNVRWAFESPELTDKYWFRGVCANAEDGDTATVIVTSTSHHEATSSNEWFKYVKNRRVNGYEDTSGPLTALEKGNLATIRFAGIDCRETPKYYVTQNSDGDDIRVPSSGYSWDDILDADDRNYSWLLSWGYPSSDEYLQKAYDLATDAKLFAQFIVGKEVVVVLDDADEDRINGDFENGVGVDTYNRFLGVIYIKDNGVWKNINRSMLMSESRSFKKHALAEVVLYASTNGHQRTTLDLDAWYEDQIYTPADKKEEEYNIEGLIENGVMLNPHQISVANVNLREHPSTEAKILTLIPEGVAIYIEKTREYEDLTMWGYTQYMGLSGWIHLSYFEPFNGNYSEIEKENNYKATDNFKDYLIKELGATIDGNNRIIFGEYDTSSPEFVSNKNLIPADSEVYDVYTYSQDDRDKLDGYEDLTGEMWDNLAGPGFTRIGDCTFIIPPLSFNVTTESQVSEIPSLRAKSTSKSQSGQARRTIRLELFFNGVEELNGYVVPREDDRGISNGIPPGMVYYRNGLRPLLAQFKVAPFLPIENSDLNNIGIHAVAFKDIFIETMPGFPGCIKATLDLLEFDHSSYMPTEDDLDEAINWKLFRWNYQRLLQPNNALKGRTYLQRVSSLEDNPVFYRIKEEDLADRAEAIKKLKNFTHPDIYEQAFNEDTDFEGYEHDANIAKVAKEQKEKLDNWYSQISPSAKKCLVGDNNTFRANYDDFEKLTHGERVVVQREVVEMFNKTYGVGESKEKAQIVYAPNMLNALLLIAHTSSVSSSELYHIRDGMIYFENKTGSRHTVSDGYVYKTAGYMHVNGFTGGSVIPLKAEENQRNFVADFTESFSSYLIKGDTRHNSNMDAIILRHEDNANTTNNYRAQYDAIKKIALKTESDMEYIKEQIPNDYVIEFISSSLHNRYAVLPTQSCELSSLQYLGSQTAALNMSVRTKNKEVVKAFTRMHKEALRCSRTYREGIVGSVITLSHPIFNMVGTNSVLLENMQISNSKDDKETFIINMTLKDFDKTQRMREALDQVSWGNTVSEDEVFEAMSKINKGIKRDSSNFQYAAIDLKQRMVELYPDLELPTYFEITKDLPHLNIINSEGVAFTKWSNTTGYRFLDPDFYIRVNSTVRDMIWEEITRNNPDSYLLDQQGFSAIETGPKYGETQDVPRVEFSDETMDYIKANLASVSIEETPKVFEQTSSDVSASTSDSEDLASSENSWFTGKNTGITTLDAAQAAWNEKVYSRTLFNSMLPERAQDKFKTSLLGLYDSTYELEPVNKWRPEVPNHGTVLSTLKYKEVDIKSVLEEYKTTLIEAKNRNNLIISGDFHNTLCRYVHKYFDFLPTYNKEDDGGLCYGERVNLSKEDNPSYMYGKYTISAPEVTREKVVNVMKSIIMYVSNTKHYNESSGNVNFDGISRVGLTGVNCNNSYCNMYDAAFSWRGNLELGVKYFRQCYLRAYNERSKGGLNKPESQRSPLDWAIAIYGLRDFHTNINSLSNSGFYQDVLSIFKNEFGYDVSNWFRAGNELYLDDAFTVEKSAGVLRKTRDAVIKEGQDREVTLWASIKNLFIDEYDEEERRLLFQSLDIDGNVIVAADSYYIEHSPVDLGHNGLGLTSNINEDILNGSGVKAEELDGIKSNPELWKGILKKSDFVYCIVDPYDEVENGITDFKTNELYQTVRVEYNKNRNCDGFKDDIVLGLISWDIKSRLSLNNSSRRPYDFTKYIYKIKEGAYEYALRTIADWHEAEGDDFQINHGKLNNKSILGNLYERIDVNDDDAMDSLYDDTLRENAEADYREIHCDPYLPGSLGSSSEMRDILEHDQRGRLVRAFPTFNIQLIDEGRWLHTQRIYDRFFGYNSIISIDVMKDRRYAADTAIVEFSNIYGTLSSQDSSFESGEWDYSGLDLIPGINSTDEIWGVLEKMWGLDGEEQTRAQNEKLTSLMLSPGARLSIKMGYGSNCAILPHIFIGTIHEVGAGEIVRVVAQGDGAELLNKIADADPKDSTDPGIFGLPKEPRELMVEMLSSKGGFFSNTINLLSGGVFYKNNPLGIAHFGLDNQPNSLLDEIKEKLNMHNAYGEVGYNIYTGTNIETKSQWIYTEGEKKGENIGSAFGFNVGPLWFNGDGDSPNIQIYTFDKTPWDLIQTYAYGCPDYIGSVRPFEYRSTLFFGKPWWNFIEGYKHEYVLDDEMGFIRRAVGLREKTYMQLKFYDSYSDIISNGIYASKDGVFTNVSVVYNEENGAKRTPLIQVDSDIEIEDQTTTVVSAPIKGNWFTGQIKFAECYGASALRDYTKLMYKGELVVIGDPTVKPYDLMYIADSYNDMSGTTWVRRVTHSFDMNGYTTSITPDLISTIDDMEGVSIIQYATARAANASASLLGAHTARSIYRSKIPIPIARMIKRVGASKTSEMLLNLIIDDGKLGTDLRRHRLSELSKIISEIDTNDYEKIIDFLRAKNVSTTDGLEIARAITKYADDFDDMGGLARALHHSGSSGAYAFARISQAVENLATSPTKYITKIDDFFAASGPLGSLFKVGSKEYGKVSTKVGNASSLLIKSITKGGVHVGSGGAKAAMLLGSSAFVVPALMFAGTWIISESLIEKYERYLRNRQALLLMPIDYHGRPLLAGVDGHRGCVLGDSPSKMDRFLSGNGDGIFGIMGVVNFFLGVDIDYTNPGE